MPVVDLRGRETEGGVVTLLAAAQIHRAAEDALVRAPGIALEYSAHPDMRLWGYEDGDLILLGLVGVEVRAEASAVIRDLAVHEGHRRSGIGRLLLDYLRGPAGFQALEGDTLGESAQFYGRCGFGVVPDGVMPDGATRYRFRWPD